MKKYFRTVIFGLFAILIFGGCSANDALNGSYENDESGSMMSLEIDGNDALMTVFGQSKDGKIDKSKKTILFKDKDETTEFTYKIIGDKLSLTSDDVGTIAFEKKSNKNNSKSKDSSDVNLEVSSSKSEDDKKFKYNDYFSLSTGEYEVGVDIKPIAYKVRFSFYDYSDESKEDGSGYIELTRDGETKKYDFPNDDVEKRIILKDGDMLNVVTENSDSNFSFSEDSAN